MYGIKDALKAIGKDTIQELFDFIAIAYEARDKDIDPDEYEKEIGRASCRERVFLTV